MDAVLQRVSASMAELAHSALSMSHWNLRLPSFVVGQKEKKYICEIR